MVGSKQDGWDGARWLGGSKMVDQDGWEGGAGSAARGESERATMMMALDWEILTIADADVELKDNNDGAQLGDAITVLKPLMRTLMLLIADHLEDNAYHLLGEGLGVPCRHLSKDFTQGSSLQRDPIQEVIQEIQ